MENTDIEQSPDLWAQPVGITSDDPMDDEALYALID